MEVAGFSPEIQNCIEELQVKRALTGDPGEAMCQRLLAYAAEENSNVLFGLGYYFFAEHYLHESETEKIFHCLTEGIKYFCKAKMFDYLAKAYNMMGAVAESRSNRLAALDCYHTSIQYAVEHGYTYVNAMAESNISGVLFSMKQYREALETVNSAIGHYKLAERTSYTDWNMALCLIRRGQCHIELGEPQQASETRKELEALLQEHSESRYPWFGINVFRAGCCECLGDRAGADRFLGEVLQELAGGASLMEFSDSIVDTARIIQRLRSEKRMEEFLEILEKRKIDEHMALALEIYPYRSKYLAAARRITELMECAKSYFRLYDRYRQYGRQESVKIIELRERLRAVEKEQETMLAYHQELQVTAQLDPMTGLANRTWLNEYLSGRFEDSYREKKPLGVELLDIDFFKQYNDIYGHLAGDGCIGMVAGILRAVAGESVFCARYGGDEFMVIYSDMTVEEIRGVTGEIARRVAEAAVPHSGSGCADTVTVSQGVFCRTPAGGNREWDFTSMADAALYEVKHRGRNGCRIYTEFYAIE